MDWDWENIANCFVHKLATKDRELEASGPTQGALEIARMLREQGKDYKRFVGRLPKRMAREVSEQL